MQIYQTAVDRFTRFAPHPFKHKTKALQAGHAEKQCDILPVFALGKSAAELRQFWMFNLNLQIYAALFLFFRGM